MTTGNAYEAMLDLHRRAANTHDITELERIDRALDEIVDHLDRETPAAYQRRNALANAAKVLGKRRAVRPFRSLDTRLADGTVLDPGQSDGEYDVIDVHCWLHTTHALRAEDRELLLNLAKGADANSLAPHRAVPVARMREQISRTRARGRRAYSAETR
ncbi:hypothetical protein ACFYO7_26400 [Nocardia salmonicida]|uniref:hypothetical protein n=1 Tax=Nocardia salmonicida TaxID=53431 RepID=UPI0036B852EF